MQAGQGLQGAADKASEKAPEVGGKMEDGIRSGAQQTKDKAPQAGGAAGEVCPILYEPAGSRSQGQEWWLGYCFGVQCGKPCIRQAGPLARCVLDLLDLLG